MSRDENPQTQPILVARGLHKSYGSTPAVCGVDFSLARDSYVTVLGPSGCGKTTILRLIGGFERVTSGTIDLDGASLLDIPASRRPINTVFQSYALFPHLTVAQNVAFGLSVKGVAQRVAAERVARALRLVRMEGMSDRRPRQLSGGQQQRVAVARAIVNEPKVLLLDEPLSALDRKMRKDMQIEIRDLQKRLGLTFFHVTHDQEEAFALSDWIIVMNHGRIEQQGAPDTIYRRPANAYVADFIGGSNLVPGSVTDIEGDVAVIDTSLGRFRAPCASSVGSSRRASLCLKPEQLHLCDRSAGLAATVTHVVFQGAESIVEVAVGDLKLVLRTPDRDPPSPGSSTGLAFDPERAWIVDGVQA